MIYILPVLPVLSLHILAAVLPALFLLRYIYRHDTVEKEPPALLVVLLAAGVAAALLSGVAEGMIQRGLDRLVSPLSWAYPILVAFVVVAMVEEGAKFCLLRLITWRHPAYNYRFDGIVYAVFLSLGFAAFENIQYVLYYGMAAALPRALLAVPGHMSFAVYMGIFYGRAKRCEGRGRRVSTRKNLRAAYLWPLFLHGFYDSCAMIGTTLSTIVFVVFVGAMFSRVYCLVKRESSTDVPV